MIATEEHLLEFSNPRQFLLGNFPPRPSRAFSIDLALSTGSSNADGVPMITYRWTRDKMNGTSLRLRRISHLVPHRASALICDRSRSTLINYARFRVDGRWRAFVPAAMIAGDLSRALA